jgi:predicted  nucleic acid-binding Zn-ribbon protein
MYRAIDWLLGRKKLRQERDQFKSLLGECQRRSVTLNRKYRVLGEEHKALQTNLLEAASNIHKERDGFLLEKRRFKKEKEALSTKIAFNKIEIDTLKAKLNAESEEIE